jgi:uncharacterized protein YjbJ (UPF0337 family)
MNWDRIEGKWKQRRGKAVHHWGKIMDDELAAIAGKYEELVGRLQERYGIASEEVRGYVEQLKKSNARLMELQKSLIKKEKSGRIRKERSGKKQSKPGKSSRKKIRSRTARK